jgi:hypothetical protein
MFEIPILYLVFNRSIETAQSFEIIRNIKPKYLFIAADGPRKNNSADAIECEKVRLLVLNNIDWDCEVKTLFRESNLGCGTAVQGALNWFFESVEMGIILEDDIIASPSFFEYAKNLLYKFKDDTQVFSINGCNLAYENDKFDYGVTRYFNMWGWATWKRSNDLVAQIWPKYDSQIDFKKNSKFIKTLQLPTIYSNGEWIDRWNVLFDITKNRKIDTWDYQWAYTCLKQELYCIRPNHDWIMNMGFNERSTHTPQAPHSVFKKNTIKNDFLVGNNLRGHMKLDSVYELVHVAQYWQGVIVNFASFKKKVKKYLINKFTKNGKV